jgi:HAD superfamily hydrolase (TIGR01509 family)
VRVKPPVKSGIDSILFDLDDTLLWSLPARIKARETVCSEAGIQGIDAKEFLFKLQGGSLVDALALLAREHGTSDDLFLCYRRAYWFKLQGSSSLYPGITALLDKLKAYGLKLGIVTNKYRDSQLEGRRFGCKIELERTGIDGLFSTVIGFEDVKIQKPSPDGIHLALRQLDGEPSRTLFVGDSDADIEAARSAGCISCRAVWGITESGVEPLKIPADYTANDPADILRFVAQHR